MSVNNSRRALLPVATTEPRDSLVGQFARIFAVALVDVRTMWRRPIYIVFSAIFVLLQWGLVLGNVRVQAGDVTAGGKQAWINSMFNAAFFDAALLGLLLPFLVAVTAGLPLLVDSDRRVDRMVLATPLSPLQYVFGRWLGTFIPLIICLGLFVTAQMVFFQLWPIDDPEKSRGPFSAWNFIYPAIVFGLPTLVAVSGTSMLLGLWSRQAILVFLLPIVILLGGALFLWSWSPEWLPHWANVLLMQLDPTGNRWLAETWLKADRGVEYYNTNPLGLDSFFVISRLLWCVLGIASLWIAAQIVASRMRGASVIRAGRSVSQQKQGSAPDVSVQSVAATSTVRASRIDAIDMAMRAPTLIAGTMAVLRYEMRALVRSPGIWLFTPLIILQIIGTNSVNVVWLGTVRLATSGTLAAGAFNTLTLLLIFLTLFYTVESLNREERHRTASIIRASSLPTIALLAGKILANAGVALIIVAAAFIGCLIVMVLQWIWTGILVPIELSVFFLLWGVVLLPTLIFWCAFIALVYGIVRNRYATYAVGLGALIGMGLLQQRGYLNWATNWNLWSTLVWSDLDRLEFLWPSIIANRIFVLYTAVLFILAAIVLYPRRIRDFQRTIDALQPKRIGRIAAVWSPLIVLWLVIGGWTWIDARSGFQGAVMERKMRDYWKRNDASFRDAPLARLDSVDADISLFPNDRRLEVSGTYVVSNSSDRPMSQIPLTQGAHFENLKWTLNGTAIEAAANESDSLLPSLENRAGLWVFTLEKPLAKDESVRIGFSWNGYFPKGWTLNGGGAGEFVLPSGVVLTSFNPSMMPNIGFVEGIGVDDRNASDPKEPDPDAWKQPTDPAFGSAWGSDVVLRVTGPASWQLNACGEPSDQKINGDRKTVTWKTEHPVRFFNICGGPLVRKAGDGVAVWFNEHHQWNVEVMKDTLEKCRTFYSQWFAPYPRTELRLTEFPGLASYAQGFPGNITFSESIGFLSRPGGPDDVDAVFFVTAHEAGHQWWGNMLMPGKGLGGNILSEGMANYSAWMLTRECRGEESARHVLREWEDTYVNSRSADSERPLVRTSGTRPGDTTVEYDKGGWVFSMLMDHMGRDAMLAGLQDFIAQYRNGPDFPLLQDFIAVMRTHARDVAAFDTFTTQWFERVVLPEFKVRDVVVTGPVGDPAMWTTRATIENVGTGTVTIDVGAMKESNPPQAKSADGKPAEERESSRVLTQVTIGPDGSANYSARIEIQSPFAPASVVVDPDVRMLQTRRKLAQWKP